jgi:hypothetical protein
MTKEESKKFLALIKVAYPTAYKDIDRDSAMATVNMWQRDFPTVPFNIMGMAFDSFRKKSKFPPTVADMYEELRGLHYIAIQDVLSSRDEKIRAVGKYIMQHTEEFANGVESLSTYGAVAMLGEKNINMLEGD